jgi:hypothetical protein
MAPVDKQFEEIPMLNASLKKLCGTPNNASEGNLTRNVSVSGPGDFSSMGAFAPRKGANTKGKYLVDGINIGSGGGGTKRSTLRAAGATR